MNIWHKFIKQADVTADMHRSLVMDVQAIELSVERRIEFDASRHFDIYGELSTFSTIEGVMAAILYGWKLTGGVSLGTIDES